MNSIDRDICRECAHSPPLHNCALPIYFSPFLHQVASFHCSAVTRVAFGRSRHNGGVRWLLSRTGYVSLLSLSLSRSRPFYTRVFIIKPASSVTVMRGTISAGSNFGVGRSHEPKYPAARKRRSFCRLCSVGVISGERHSLYFLLHAPHFRMHSRLVGTLVFTDFPRPCCSHCRPLPTTGGRETGENILTIVSASGIIEHRQAERDSSFVGSG